MKYLTLLLFTLALALPCAAQEVYWTFGVTDYYNKPDAEGKGFVFENPEKSLDLIGEYGMRLGFGTPMLYEGPLGFEIMLDVVLPMSRSQFDEELTSYQKYFLENLDPNFYLTGWWTWKYQIIKEIDFVFKAGPQISFFNTSADYIDQTPIGGRPQNRTIRPDKEIDVSGAFSLGFNYQFDPKTSFELSINFFDAHDFGQELSLTLAIRRL